MDGPDDQMKRFWQLQAEWSRETFGPDYLRGPVGPLKHLRKEVDEALADPFNLEEKVDCLFLIFDSARRAGHSYLDVITMAFRKLDKNKRREWPDWRTAPTDEPIEHAREAA